MATLFRMSGASQAYFGSFSGLYWLLLLRMPTQSNQPESLIQQRKTSIFVKTTSVRHHIPQLAVDPGILIAYMRVLIIHIQI